MRYLYTWMLLNGTIVHPYTYCYPPQFIPAGGMWHNSALEFYGLPSLIWQMVLMLLISRALAFLLKPICQPKIVSEIITGILLGPTLTNVKLPPNLDGVPNVGELVFPLQSLRAIELFGCLGMILFLFLVGLEFDITMVTKMQKKVVVMSTANVLLPLMSTVLVVLAMNIKAPSYVYQPTYVFFIGAAMTITAFPVLVRLLSELKLLNNDVVQVVLPSAVLSDFMAWAFLAVILILPTYSDRPSLEDLPFDEPVQFASLWMILCSIGFVLICWLVIRPMMCWMVRRTPEGEPMSDTFCVIIVNFLLVAVLVTDAIGYHAVLGAFIFGVMVPQGPLTVMLKEKLEEFVVNILLPLFFANIGLKTDFSRITIQTGEDVKILIALVLMFLLTVAVKVISSTLIAQYYSLPGSYGLSVGLLMSIKGPIEMIILDIGKQKQVFDVRTYTILVLGSVLTTLVIAPTVAFFNRTTRSRISYKRRNLLRSRPDMELRMMACVHTPRNVPSIISLLQMSNPTKRSPIFVYAVHLLELVGRTKLLVHDTSLRRHEGQFGGVSGTMVHSEQIISAFENYEQQAGGVSVQPLTVVSPYSTMHEEIFNLAEERHATFIILPFHKLLSASGEFEDISPSIRDFNQSILAHAPCSVGILVDKGFSQNGRSTVGQQVPHNVALLFFGGPDDREALAFSWRMAENSGHSLTVVRFIPRVDVMMPLSPTPSSKASTDEVATTTVAESTERQLDDECINQFRLRFVSDSKVIYTEKIVSNTEETVAAIRTMSSSHNMYVVGKGRGMESSSSLVGLMEWAEYPELGPIGDMLVSADMDQTVSVLVVQQYIATEAGAGGLSGIGLESTRQSAVQRYFNNAYQMARHGMGFSSQRSDASA